MKKFLFPTLLFILTGACACNSTMPKQNNPAKRQEINLVSNKDYFEEIHESESNGKHYILAKKKMPSNQFIDYQPASYSNNEYLVSFEAITDLENGIVTLNVYLDDKETVIIEDFTGVIMTNYNDEKDVLFVVDDIHIFLSELQKLTMQEQCSWFGNALHKTINGSLIAMTYVEPVVKVITMATAADLLNRLGNELSTLKYHDNYKHNSKLQQPTGYIDNQHSYSNWKFGITNFADTGCEVIAGYNLLYALGKNGTLAETILYYENCGIELGNAGGKFGSNPYQITYFLKGNTIKHEKVIKSSDFESKMKDDKNYYIILSRWNSEEPDAMIHTFFIDKDVNSSKKFQGYNSYTSPTSNINDFFKGRIDKTYIVSYFVEK